MRIAIPEKTKKQIKVLLTKGDCANISREIHSDASGRVTVKNVINNGVGDADVVKAIVTYFNKKEKLTKALA